MSLDLHHLLTALRDGPRIFTAHQLATDAILLRTIRRALACGLIARPASLYPAAYESGQSDCNLSRGISIRGLTAKGFQYLETLPAAQEAADAGGTSGARTDRPEGVSTHP